MIKFNELTEMEKVLLSDFVIDGEIPSKDFGCITLVDYEYLPDVQCIYFVVGDDSLLYIGRATSLNERFRTGHHKGLLFGQHEAPCITWIETGELSRGELSGLEARYIKANNPLYNR